MQVDRAELDRLVAERREANDRRHTDPASEAFGTAIVDGLRRSGLLDREPPPPDDGDPRSEAQQFGDVLAAIRKQIKEN